MIVSWNWLKEYVPLEMDVAELEHRLAMAGLNHESTAAVGDDLAIDLEVTSNRPDCLGHLGVAREISVLWNLPLPSLIRSRLLAVTDVSQSGEGVDPCPELCSRYTARVIRGVKIGPSPTWLVRSFAAHRAGGDQQRGGCQQLCHDGMRSAAARV